MLLDSLKIVQLEIMANKDANSILLNEINKLPCIWNEDDEHYYDREFKTAVWIKMYSKVMLCFNAGECPFKTGKFVKTI